MPIRFTCPHCGKLLGVAHRKIGQAIQCPSCNGGVIVPPPLEDSPADQRGRSPSDPPTAESDQTQTKPVVLPPSFVAVSRSTLYSIAGVIVGASILSFVLGFLMGQTTPTKNGLRNANTPKRITGRLQFQSIRGGMSVDSEAVVIVLPVGRQPDEKLSPEAVRPDAVVPDAQHPTVLGIRSIGGDFARTESNGSFSIEVPKAGEYYVLFMSAHIRRSDDVPPTTIEIAQIARYFKQADMLLGANAYRWSKEVIQGDAKLEHTFIER